MKSVRSLLDIELNQFQVSLNRNNNVEVDVACLFLKFKINGKKKIRNIEFFLNVYSDAAL